MPAVRLRTPASTGRTVCRATACSSRWSSRGAPCRRRLVGRRNRLRRRQRPCSGQPARVPLRSILVRDGTRSATCSGLEPAWCETNPVCARRLVSASALRQPLRAPPRCRRCSCTQPHPPPHWCAKQPWLARRAAGATSVLISPKQAINGMAISSCTRTEEHALTVTFRPITESLSSESIDLLIESALAEDVGAGDVTTQAVIPMDMTCRGKIVCKQDGVIAGLSIAQRVFQRVDERIQFDPKTKDGEKVQADQIVARLFGPARGMMTAERVGLNFLQHLSGIATMTAKYVKAVDGTKAQILDTRKTTPGLRAIEKYATRMGGAVNHRMGLYDAVLIKDTHLALVGGITPALRAARKAYPEMEIHVEVSNLQELEQALTDKASHILLDNFSCGQVREAMQLIRGRATVEVSGGVQVTNARAYALAGADFISVGALPHAVPPAGCLVLGLVRPGRGWPAWWGVAKPLLVGLRIAE